MRRTAFRIRVLVVIAVLLGAAIWGLISTGVRSRPLTHPAPTYESLRTYRTTFNGTLRLVAGDPLPACTPVLLDKQSDAGGDPANHPIFVLWVGFEDSSGRLLDVDDAEADVSYKCLTREARLLSTSEIMFDRNVIIALERVPASGARVQVELVGMNGVVSSFTLSTSDRPDPRGRDISFWRKKSE